MRPNMEHRQRLSTGRWSYRSRPSDGFTLLIITLFRSADSDQKCESTFESPFT